MAVINPTTKSWCGPFVGEFTRVSNHTETIRYSRYLSRHGFDFYVPQEMFPANIQQWPATIQLCIGRSPHCVSAYFQRFGALAPEQPLTISDVWQFEHFEAVSCSIRYRSCWKYSLYIPKEVFCGRLCPNVVHVALGLRQ